MHIKQAGKPLRTHMFKTSYQFSAMQKISKNINIAHQVQIDQASCHFYTVLETKQGSIIVTEILENGAVSWVQNPNNLEDRNSLAKLLFQVNCKEHISVRDVSELGTSRGLNFWGPCTCISAIQTIKHHGVI